MKIFGLVGRSGSGKTTLMVALLPALRRRGLTVSTLKHAHHGFDIDKPGKDSFRHREAGAEEVMLVSGTRWALLHEIRASEDEPPLEALIARMSPVDLLLIEGFHTHGHPTIEVHRPTEGHALMWRPGSDIVAVATDAALADPAVPTLDLADVEAIADTVLRHAGLAEAPAPSQQPHEPADRSPPAASRWASAPSPLHDRR